MSSSNHVVIEGIFTEHFHPGLGFLLDAENGHGTPNFVEFAVTTGRHSFIQQIFS